MSRTKRIYNRKKLYPSSELHPYKQICMGRCKRCKDLKQDQKKRTMRMLTLKEAILLEVEF